MRFPLLVLLLVPLAGCLSDAPTDDTPAQDVPVEAEMSAMPQWGDLDAPIRPGASLGGYCTFNFLFYDNVTGDAYIGTAGHCTDEVGERLELPGVGEIASVVFDSDLTGEFPGTDALVDFTLALLDPEMVNQSNPQMLSWDGPTGAITQEDLMVGDQIQLHGYGMILGQQDATRDRFGALVNWDEREYAVDMPAVNGDSGSPLLHGDTGKAFGIVSRFGFDATPPSTDMGPLMTFVMDQIHLAGFPNVQLATIAA